MKLTGYDFISLYLTWLKENISFDEVGQFVELTTPFLDRHNDHIQIYVQQTESGLVLTDDGYTVNDLVASGCDVYSDKRKDILKFLVTSLGVILDHRELKAEANITNFAPKKHALIQAILSVNDMFMLSQNKVVGLFLEDVQAYFDSNNVRYIQPVSFYGKSGLSHMFDFAIPASQKNPERLVKVINQLTKEKAESILFSWNDIQENRASKSKLYVFVNDDVKGVKPDVANAFLQYGINSVPWSQRDQVIKKLSA